MGRDLMCIEPFYQSIMRSDAVLRPYGINLYDMLMTSDEKTFEDTLKSFVGIAAIQVWTFSMIQPVNCLVYT